MQPEQIEPIAAGLIGLVMGLWAGAYLISLWRDSEFSSQKKFGYGAGVIGGMGGLPSAAAYGLIEAQAIWCVVMYMIALLVPAALSYINAMRGQPMWEPPDPESFER